MVDMSEIFYRIKTLSLASRILLGSLAGLLIVGLFLWAFASMLFPPSSARHAVSNSHTTAPSAPIPVSPLIFGTNLGLFTDQDQVLTSALTRSRLQQIHAQIIRIPVRSPLSEATEIQALQAVKNLGLVPTIDLLMGTDTNAQNLDARMVKDANKVFGNSTVYYEYGNEEDLLGTSANSYTTSWNAVIPQLKALSPQAHFVGPVTYHYDQTFLTAFLTGAQPRPDEVSWHEYTCVSSDSKDTCLANIRDWTTHITSARSVMTNTLGKALPIMITEWNYAPDVVADSHTSDAKSKDNTFLSTWTQQALQTLAANQVFASMQYFCTSSVPLVASDNSIAAQGQVFQVQYEHLVAQPSNLNAALRATATAVIKSVAATTPTVTLQLTPTDTPQASPTDTPQPSPTDTPQPAPTDTPQPSPTVDAQTLYTTVTGSSPAYSTTLANQDGGQWDNGPFSGGGSCGFAGSSYQVVVPQQGSAGVCIAHGTYISNFAYQVQMTITSGNGGGIVFRDANQQMYRFRIGSDGSYALASQDKVLATGTNTAIKTGLNQTNELMVIAQNQQISIYVNKQSLASVNDTASGTGALGLFAVNFTSSTTVTFSNVQVWRL